MGVKKKKKKENTKQKTFFICHTPLFIPTSFVSLQTSRVENAYKHGRTTQRHSNSSTPPLDSSDPCFYSDDDGLHLLEHHITSIHHTQSTAYGRWLSMDISRIWFLYQQLHHFQFVYADAVHWRHNPRQMWHTLHWHSSNRRDALWQHYKLLCNNPNLTNGIC